MKRKTIKILGMFGAMAVGIMGTSPVKAIPVDVDTFETDHNERIIFIRSSTPPFIQGSPQTGQVSGSGIIGSAPDNERDIFLEATATGDPEAQTLAGLTTAPPNSITSLAHESQTGTTTTTLSLTYDGDDGSADPTGAGFDTTSGLGGIDVTGPGSVPNNVFTIKGFNSNNDLVDITIELYDDNGEMRDVSFDFRSNTATDITIALTEGEILGGIDTTDDNVGSDTSDNLFFESNSATTSFDFTQVTAVKFQTKLDGFENYTAEGLRFERIPFEAESSIGIALLGAWGIWKRWKKKGEEMAEEPNVSSS
jgi:hypothetical protein